jgi:hypothetical protein
MRTLRAAATALSVAAVAACTSPAHPVPPLPAPVPVSVPPSAPVSSSASGAVVAGDAFLSPSKNIGCGFAGDTVRCFILDKTWTAPPKPATCEWDWGSQLVLTGAAPAEFACVSDLPVSSPTGEVVLPYGQRMTAGPLVCTTAETGVTCENTQTHHGLSLSRETYRIH